MTEARKRSGRGGWRALLCGVAAALCAAGTATAGDATPAPQRIASIYLCADQLVLRLADRARIVSLSRFAAQPAISGQADAIAGIPLNRGRAEELLIHEPDLIVAGQYTAPATKAMLRKLGISVLELPTATNFDDIRANIRRVATALGTPDRGQRLIADLDRRLRAVRPGDTRRPSLLLYRIGGYSHGRNTLANDLFATAGFGNYTASRFTGVGRLSLEATLLDPPDAIALGTRNTPRDSLAAELLSHPAFRYLRARTPTTVLPDRLWICGLPASVEGAERLSVFRRAITAPAPRGTEKLR
jgi:iron complex transport system substrate-binding protein